MFCTVIFLLQFSLLKSAMQILHGSDGRPLIIMLRWRLLKLWLTIFCLLPCFYPPTDPPTTVQYFLRTTKTLLSFGRCPATSNDPSLSLFFSYLGPVLMLRGHKYLSQIGEQIGIKLAMLALQTPNSSVCWSSNN